jgi:hypothetical protein
MSGWTVWLAWYRDMTLFRSLLPLSMPVKLVVRPVEASFNSA